MDKALEEKKKEYQELSDGISSFNSAFDNPTNNNSLSNLDVDNDRYTPKVTDDSSKKEKEAQKDVSNIYLKVEANKLLKNQLDKVNSALERHKQDEEALVGNDLIEAKRYEIELLKQKATLMDGMNENNKKALTDSQDLLKKYGFNIEGDVVVNRNERLLQLQNEANNATGDQKKNLIETLKNLDKELDVNENLVTAITKYNTEHKSVEIEAEKVKDIIRETMLLINNNKLKDIEETSKDIESQLNRININENESLDRQLNKLKTKANLEEESIQSLKDRQEVYKNNISFLEQELQDTTLTEKTRENIGNLIVQENDKLKQNTQEILNQQKIMKDTLENEYEKIIEMSIFGDEGLLGEQRRVKDRIELIDEEIKALQKKWDLEKFDEEKADKEKELADLREKINLMDLDNLKNLSEERAKELGLLEKREEVLRLDEERKERQKKLEQELIDLEKQRQNLLNNKPIQTFSSVGGVWDLRYTQDQEEIDKINETIADKKKQFDKEIADSDKKLSKDLSKEKDKLIEELRKKEQDYSRWLLENDRKLELERLNQEKENIQKELSIKEEFYNESKRLAIEAFDGGDPNSITGIIEEAMNNMSSTTRYKWSNILDFIRDSVGKSKNSIDELIRKMQEIPADTGWETPTGGSNSGKVLMSRELANKIYLDQNEDVKTALKLGHDSQNNALDFKDGYTHWQQYGLAEGREGWWFDLIGKMIDKDSLPSIPQFKDGGMTKADGWAKLHESEVILPKWDSGQIIKADRLLESANFSKGILEKVNMLSRIPDIVATKAKDVVNTFSFNGAKFEFPNVTNGNDAEAFYKTLTTNGFTYMNRNQ